ncbi:unnamed protein product [Clonostachys byssicola]|uniref:Uncharacterized protein n=1 Tax=Clonostachys byssicola TaxID=160290 RepID=A0A9N9Y349_9HYPO|nr:unnamed protein product [Clonostachys byssicola]
MIFRAPGNERLHNGFNWTGKFSFGQGILPDDDEATRKAKVEKQVHRLTSDFKWNDDGLRRDPDSGRPTWFDGLVGPRGITKNVGALYPPHISRDGMAYLYCGYGPIPQKYLNKLIKVIDKEETHLPLEE